MFAKRKSLKSNYAHAYQVLEQTSLCPADYLEQSMRIVQTDASMIQFQAISVSLDWQSGQVFLIGRGEGRQRYWRQKIGEFPKLG